MPWSKCRPWEPGVRARHKKVLRCGRDRDSDWQVVFQVLLTVSEAQAYLYYADYSPIIMTDVISSLSAFINRDPNVQGIQLANRHRLLDCYQMQCVRVIGGFFFILHQLVNLYGTKYDNVEPQCSVEASSSSKKKYTEADDQHVAKI